MMETISPPESAANMAVKPHRWRSCEDPRVGSTTPHETDRVILDNGQQSATLDSARHETSKDNLIAKGHDYPLSQGAVSDKT